MKKELWNNPYSWQVESQELADRIKKYFLALSSAKRVQIDPFTDSVRIRCTTANCKTRYEINRTAHALLCADSTQDGFGVLRDLGPDMHEHFYLELGLGKQSLSLWGYRFLNNKSIAFCGKCLSFSPFPVNQTWSHACSTRSWQICLGKSNTLTWKRSASGVGYWILQVDFEHTTWRVIAAMPGVVYDDAGIGFIIPDDPDSIQEIANLCKTQFPMFRHLSKPRERAATRPLAISQRAIIASEILSAIPAEFHPRVKKAIQSIIHPDRDPDRKEELTKIFQNFEAAWVKWSNL